jgi:hypothetical protein
VLITETLVVRVGACFKARTVLENSNNKIVSSKPSRHINFGVSSVLVLSRTGFEMRRSHIQEVMSSMKRRFRFLEQTIGSNLKNLKTNL